MTPKIHFLIFFGNNPILKISILNQSFISVLYLNPIKFQQFKVLDRMNFFVIVHILTYVFLGTSQFCPKLIWISVPGLRISDVSSRLLLNLRDMYKSGLRVSYVEPFMFSNPIVNEFSQATGLYPNQHGIFTSEMEEKSTGEKFNWNTNEASWWSAGKHSSPIWMVNEEMKGSSFVYNWPGIFALHGRTQDRDRDVTSKNPINKLYFPEIFILEKKLSQRKFNFLMTTIKDFYDPDFHQNKKRV